MPITTIGSYPPTMQEFIVHWTSVNAALAPNPLLLAGGYTLANFTADRTAIVNAINAVIAEDNAAAMAAGYLDTRKVALRPHCIRFRRWVTGYLPGTGYARALPVTPPPSAVESRFIDPLQDMLVLWETINTDAPAGVPLPLTLAGDYTADMFTDDMVDLRNSFMDAKNKAEKASLLRKQRDTLFKPAEQRMKTYRDIITAMFPPDSPFVLSLPALSPPPGSTPAPVELTALWNAGVSAAVLNWTASDNTHLASYSVRACTGGTYKVANEFVVADVTPDVLTCTTAAGLPVTGSKVVYRVYVVVTTGNERGSNNAPVTRP